jgi:type II secretory ATPase GspE/PulE/Tfp pilus assembly ATPase PilB-like protein/8-oxo-dGTP pyrophosphatase MutT (NUDIX family)
MSNVDSSALPCRVPDLRPTRTRDPWLRPILAERISADALRILDEHVQHSYWETAVRRSLVEDDEILAVLAERFRIKRAGRLSVSSQARERISEDLARRYHVLPLALTDSALEIATANPFDLDCERTLAFVCGRRIRITLASPLRIAERIEEVYRPEDVVARLLDGIAERYDVETVTEDVGLVEDESVSSGEQPVVRLVDHILANAVAARASDIHLDPGERSTAVRYRVDGVLREVMTLPRAVAIPLVSRIKIMGRLDIADRLRPQGGRARVAVDGRRMDLRVSTLPVAHGEKVVVRLLDPRSTSRSLDSLGFNSAAANRISRLLDARDGLVLVTGPTGSGKTTTLYALLRQLLRRGVNIVTVEDPVEYRIPGMVQVQVNEKAGLTFASALRSILRQDPDIVLIGEVRDRETAAIAIQAALTGHLVFATLHTIDACTSVMRLLDLGVDRNKTAAALRGIIAQRLLRRSCAACAGIGSASSSHCSYCGGARYNGRLAIAEVVLASPMLERAIIEGAGLDPLLSITRRDGAQSLWDAGLVHVASGATTREELRRVVDAPGALPSDRQYDSVMSRDTHAKSSGTAIIAGVVDVYVLRRAKESWRVLTLQRTQDTRCPGTWETVHGRIEPGERPEDAAVREVREETGLALERLYNATVQPFYLHMFGAVQLAVVFAAVVGDGDVTLGVEHDRFEWLAPDEAMDRFIWPRSREALKTIVTLLATGDAGPVEDVLRVK